jgi:rRNA-processing protein FCF1
MNDKKTLLDIIRDRVDVRGEIIDIVGIIGILVPQLTDEEIDALLSAIKDCCALPMKGK